MHFQTKNILKNNHYHNINQAICQLLLLCYDSKNFEFITYFFLIKLLKNSYGYILVLN
jgi:hypothetical protein